MKLLGNISYGYHFMDRSRHTITNCLGDEKTHKAINENFFKQLHVVNKDLYEVELIKSTIEHREQIYIDVCEKWFIENYGLPLSILVLFLKETRMKKLLKETRILTLELLLRL